MWCLSLRLAALIAALCAAVAASAQTRPEPRPPIWSGPYFGLTLGYGGATIVGPDGGTVEPDGRETSLYTGFNWLRGNYMFGVEYDLTLNIGRDNVFDDRLPVDDIDAAVDWLTSLRGRFGYTDGQTLVFATAGLAYSDTVSVGRSYDTGWVAGVGMEQMFSQDRWSVRGEVLSYRFSPDGDPRDAELDDAWIARIGIARHF